MTTIDFSLEDGDAIPIEERDPEEVKSFAGQCVTVPDIEVRNPAFDVTPAQYITAIITEKGVAKPPFGPSLASFKD
jgi:methylthioribose-1-phosphate isomerase